MTSKVFKLLNDYVGVYTRINSTHNNSNGSSIDLLSIKTDKMSYKDFYAMLRDLDTKVVEKETVTKDLTAFNNEHIDKYQLLMDKLNYNRLPLNLKQFTLSDEEVVLTLEMGNENQYFMTDVYDADLDFVKKPLDKKSVYIVVLKIGFSKRLNEKSIVRPNALMCESIYRKNIKVIGGKAKIELEEIPYLKDKLQDNLDVNINNKKGSKIKVVKDALLNNKSDIESILRFVTEKELRNIKFTTRLDKSIAEKTPINWEGLKYK